MRPQPDRPPADGPTPAPARAPVRPAAAAAAHSARPTRTFVLAAVVSWGLLLAVFALLVLTGSGQRLENLGLEGATLRTDPTRNDSLLGLSTISVASFGLAIVLATGFAVLRGLPVLGMAVFVVMSGSVVLAEVLKELVARPALVEGPAWLLRNSFPSGHVAVAAATAVGLLLVVPARVRWLGCRSPRAARR